MTEERGTVSEDGLTAGQRLSAALSRRSGRPGGRSLLASVVLHGVLALVVLVGGGLLAEDLPEFQTMRVRIVSPPPREAGERTPAPPEEAVVPVEITPDPEPPKPEPPKPEPEKPPVTKPEPKPETKPATPPPPPEKKPAEQTSRGERPDPTSKGGENLNIVRDGQEFPFPDYLANIETQLYRYMRWDGSPDLEVQLAFAIERDGSVGSVDILRRSGNARFDLAAVNAVNVAARNGEFGPLPDAYASDKLWVRFTYKKPE